MAKLRGAILAAGRGVRMGGDQPKTLLPIDGHGPLLQYILQGLDKAGVSDLIVVTGHMPQAVMRYVGDNWSHDVQYVRNTRYASWGNFHSIRMAIDQSPGTDLVVVNSDIVVQPDVYGRVLGTEGDLVLAVQRRYNLTQEDMRVRVDGTRVRRIGKDLPRALSHGEFCGVSLLRAEATRLYADVATRLEWTAETHVYYEDVYDRMIDRIDARAAWVDDGEYAEVDTPEDIGAARAVLERFAEARPG